ncbi:MAG: methylated-DNA--[protein]-cysteine S-methyltransferase [Candidatus Spyradenecus sp.]
MKKVRLMEAAMIEAGERWFVRSPFGMVCLRARGEVVTGLSFEEVGEAVGEVPPVVQRARAWVADYFRGRFRPLDFPIEARGTPFQLRVWAFVRELAVGETRSYGEVAAALGCGSARAVGQALGRNPLLLLIPCHRVIGAHGLGGYAGGLERKRALLMLEGVEGIKGGLLLRAHQFVTFGARGRNV